MAAKRPAQKIHGKVRLRGHARLSPEEAKLQSMLMLQQRMAGKSVSEIARLFNMGKLTAGQRLKAAELQEIYQTARDVVAARIVPAALEVVEEKLVVDRDGDMAKDVMYGTGILSKNINLTATLQPADEDFDQWRRDRKALPAVTVTEPTPEPDPDDEGGPVH